MLEEYLDRGKVMCKIGEGERGNLGRNCLWKMLGDVGGKLIEY